MSVFPTFYCFSYPHSYSYFQSSQGDENKAAKKGGSTSRGLPPVAAVAGPLMEDGKPNLHSLAQHLVDFSYVGGQCFARSLIGYACKLFCCYSTMFLFAWGWATLPHHGGCMYGLPCSLKDSSRDTSMRFPSCSFFTQFSKLTIQRLSQTLRPSKDWLFVYDGRCDFHENNGEGSYPNFIRTN